jgi:hypothetical protein
LIKSQNAFLGICRPDESYVKALKEFADNKPEFYKVINDFLYLSEKDKKAMINYLNGFYRSLENIDGILNNFSHECKQF